MNLHRASGRIESLRIVEDKRNVLFGPQMQEAAGLSAIVFAAAGMGGAAAQTSMNSDAADDVALYSFEVDGVQYAGCTRKATFRDGDELEIVFERRRDGNEVFAVRRPSSRSIWLYPYMSCGTLAAIRRGIKLWLLSSLCASVLIFGSFGLLDALRHGPHFDFVSFLHSAAQGSGFLLATLLVVMLFMAPRYLRFAKAADKVFSALGYPNPKSIDLHKTTKSYRKNHRLPHSDIELRY